MAINTGKEDYVKLDIKNFKDKPTVQRNRKIYVRRDNCLCFRRNMTRPKIPKYFFDKNKPVKDDSDTKNSSPDGGFHIGDSIKKKKRNNAHLSVQNH